MIRIAKMADVESILKLINNYADQGLMLRRSPFDIYRKLTAFCVCEVDGKVVGCSHLSIVWKDLAEVASLAVSPEYKGKGYGRELVDWQKVQAKSLGISQMFTLTYQTAFFEKCGFRHVSKETLPHKVFGDCLRCPKIENCDEHALIYDIK